MISLTEDQTLTALRGFLTSLLSIEVVAGQDNRVAEPIGDFAEMTPIMQKRICTNETSYRDCVFIGSVSGTTLTVTDLAYGVIEVGNQLFGSGVTANTIIMENLTGDTFRVNNSQAVASRKLSAGLRDDLVPKEVTIQVDIHGPGSTENAAIVEAYFRSDWGYDKFSESGYDVVPLYCDSPRQAAFNNAEQQSEKRWMIDCTLQCNPIVTVPQQFADVVQIETTVVETLI